MRYLKQLLYIKAPSNAALLDIALILALLPHLFILKSAMIGYIFIAFFFIIKKKKSAQYVLAFLGIIAIGFTFFNNYNFSNFSKMEFFVSLISALLIYAISLQRLSGVMNFYLKASPMFLMLLSFFFFNSITMLFYSIFVLYIFVLLMIFSRMDATLMEVLKLNSQLFLLSIPMVVFLFMVFPRISFQKAQFGFKSQNYSISGYDGKMSVNSNEVILSNRVVMEVYFSDIVPNSSELYFRGSTLYNYNNQTWQKKSSPSSKGRVSNGKRVIDYEIVLYPHSNRWIYALDIPTKSPKGAKLNFDYTITSMKPIVDIKRYKLSSVLEKSLLSDDLAEALKLDESSNKRTYDALKTIRESDIEDFKKADALVGFFKYQGLKYTLKPKGFKSEDFVDSFLFENKNGYCVHFSSAFAQSARMIGIPSRIVSGFKADKSNMLKNYLIVKESDAHAWVELYLKGRGWVRFDPTATASKYESSLDSTAQNAQDSAAKESLFQKANLYFMYVKYIINSWILNYDRLKQTKILNELLNDTLYLLKLLFSFLTLVAISVILFLVLKSSTCKTKLECEMAKLLKILKKRDLIKSNNETMNSFLIKSQYSLNLSLEEINRLYHKIRYSDEEVDIVLLKNEIEKFKNALLKGDN